MVYHFARACTERNQRLVLVSPWNMLIMRNFFMALPESLEEAAIIDGASPLRRLPLNIIHILTKTNYSHDQGKYRRVEVSARNVPRDGTGRSDDRYHLVPSERRPAGTGPRCSLIPGVGSRYQATARRRGEVEAPPILDHPRTQRQDGTVYPVPQAVGAVVDGSGNHLPVHVHGQAAPRAREYRVAYAVDRLRSAIALQPETGAISDRIPTFDRNARHRSGERRHGQNRG